MALLYFAYKYLWDNFWLILLVLAGYFFFSAVRRTVEAAKSTEKLNRKIEEAEKQRRLFKEKIDEIAGTDFFPGKKTP